MINNVKDIVVFSRKCLIESILNIVPEAEMRK